MAVHDQRRVHFGYLLYDPECQLNCNLAVLPAIDCTEQPRLEQPIVDIESMLHDVIVMLNISVGKLNVTVATPLQLLPPILNTLTPDRESSAIDLKVLIAFAMSANVASACIIVPLSVIADANNAFPSLTD